MPTNRDPDQFLIGGNFTMWAGPVGTAMPTDLTTALNPAFIDLGYSTDDGATVSTSKEVRETTSSQSRYPTNMSVTSASTTLQSTFQQWNPFNIALAFSAGADGVEETSADSGVWKLEASEFEIDFRALVLEVVDGLKRARFCVPKAMVTEGVEIPLKKDDESTLPITFGVIATGAAKPWTLLGNNVLYGIAD